MDKLFQNSIFSEPLPLNRQLVTSNNNHLNPDYKYYKHCNPYNIPESLQKYYGKTSAYHVIYHSEEDIQEGTYFLNYKQNFGAEFPPLAIADKPVYLYIIEQSTDGSLEQIHLILVQNELELGSKHYFLAKKLDILTRVVEAGEIKRIDSNTIEYNTESGTWMNFNEKNMLIPKKTNVVEYFQKLGEINNINFIKVNKPLFKLSLSIEDIKFFSLGNKVFYDPDLKKCSNDHIWEIVGQDVFDRESGIPIKNILSQDFQEIIQIPKVNKLLCQRHLENSTHYARPLGNFIKLPNLENAKDLSNFWPKIISRSEIIRNDLENFINKYKYKHVIKITVDMFLGPSGNIFKEDLPNEIKEMLI